MNTTPKQPPEFGVYTISKDYLAYIRQVDPNVVDPEITNTYVGPLCRINDEDGPVDMFAPVDVKSYKSKKYFYINYSDGVFANLVDLKCMIPCFPEEYKLDESNKLKNFLSVDAEFLKDCAREIMENSLLG